MQMMYAKAWREWLTVIGSLALVRINRPDVTGVVRQHGLETQIHLTASEGETDIQLAIPGRHNAKKCFAAAYVFGRRRDNFCCQRPVNIFWC